MRQRKMTIVDQSETRTTRTHRPTAPRQTTVHMPSVGIGALQYGREINQRLEASGITTVRALVVAFESGILGDLLPLRDNRDRLQLRRKVYLVTGYSILDLPL